ncbi:anti-sigma factor [Sphingomonas sp. LB-2]|uniref:anti-sigma factor family protein n=1 Tax=Sphingomonas caeni TaxID=2984949 RepID=UPI0022327DD8|nr:anti-sigma factor [Sphingomonas caeni]MCW3849271.1 anti-sigma factor [Sphingomonas caeni]
MTPKNEITAETLMAYADGELDAVTAKRVEKAVAADPALAEQVEKHRLLRTRLRAHFDPVAAAPAPDRLAAMLRSSAKVVDLGAARAARQPKPPRPVFWRNAGAIAAALVLGVALGLTSRTGLGGGPSFGAQSGDLVAQGEMAKALDTQLASKDGLVRLSFRNAEGNYCRVFETAGRSGVACKGDGGWTIRNYRASGAAEKGEYRQAGSAAVMADAQEMMKGEALDAAGEKAAVAKGWRAGN